MAAEAIVTLGLGAMNLQDTSVTFAEERMVKSVMALLAD